MRQLNEHTQTAVALAVAIEVQDGAEILLKRDKDALLTTSCLLTAQRPAIVQQLGHAPSWPVVQAIDSSLASPVPMTGRRIRMKAAQDNVAPNCLFRFRGMSLQLLYWIPGCRPGCRCLYSSVHCPRKALVSPFQKKRRLRPT